MHGSPRDRAPDRRFAGLFRRLRLLWRGYRLSARLDGGRGRIYRGMLDAAVQEFADLPPPKDPRLAELRREALRELELRHSHRRARIGRRLERTRDRTI